MHIIYEISNASYHSGISLLFAKHTNNILVNRLADLSNIFHIVINFLWVHSNPPKDGVVMGFPNGPPMMHPRVWVRITSLT